MQQIVDLQNSQPFQAQNVALVSIATDSITELSAAAQEWNVTTPLLSDSNKQVSEQYDVLQWAVLSGEPGHTFVLVNQDGAIAWIRDYGAPENGGLMYVPPDDLVQAINAATASP